MNNTFYSPFSKMATFFTIIIIVLGILSIALLYLSTSPPTTKYAVSIILIAVIFIAYALHPVSYTLNKDSIIITSPLRKKIIHLDESTTIRQITKGELGLLIRTFGSSGLFGNIGLFHSSKAGVLEVYTTDSSNMVLIKTNKKRYLISPDNPKRFVDDFSTAK